MTQEPKKRIKGPEDLIGDRITELRNEKDWSRSELSRQSGVSLSSLNMYERKERMPGAREIRKLSDCLDVSADYLLFGKRSTGSELMSSTEYFAEMDNAAIVLSVMCFFSLIPKEDALAYARMLFSAAAPKLPREMLSLLQEFSMDWGKILFDGIDSGDLNALGGLLSSELPGAVEKLGKKYFQDEIESSE